MNPRTEIESAHTKRKTLLMLIRAELPDINALKNTLSTNPLEAEEPGHWSSEIDLIDAALDEYFKEVKNNKREEVIFTLLDYYRSIEHPNYIRMLFNCYDCLHKQHELRPMILEFSALMNKFIQRIYTDRLTINHLEKCEFAKHYSEYEKMFSSLHAAFNTKLTEGDNAAVEAFKMSRQQDESIPPTRDDEIDAIMAAEETKRATEAFKVTAEAFKMGNQDESTIIGLLARNIYFTNIQRCVTKEVAGRPVRGWADFIRVLAELGINTESKHLLYNQGDIPVGISDYLENTCFWDDIEELPTKAQCDVFMFDLSGNENEWIDDALDSASFIETLPHFTPQQIAQLNQEVLSGEPRSRFGYFMVTKVMSGLVCEGLEESKIKLLSHFFSDLFDAGEMAGAQADLYRQLPNPIKQALGLKRYLDHIDHSNATLEEVVPALKLLYKPGDVNFNIEMIIKIAAHFNVKASTVYMALPKDIRNVLVLLNFLQPAPNDLFPSQALSHEQARKLARSTPTPTHWLETLLHRIQGGKSNIRDVVLYLGLAKDLELIAMSPIVDLYLNKEFDLRGVEHQQLTEALLLLSENDADNLKIRLDIIILRLDMKLRNNVTAAMNQPRDDANKNLLVHLIGAGRRTAEPKNTGNIQKVKSLLDSTAPLNSVDTLFQYLAPAKKSNNTNELPRITQIRK